jgi:acetaldehyde dehydrogenase
MGRGAIPAAILGPGNIGTDLLMKLRRSSSIDVVMMTGIDPDSPGLARARSLGVETSARGAAALLDRDDIRIVFDATSAAAHLAHAPALEAAGITLVDLTPAARGPYVVPSVNLAERRDSADLNMVTCGGQATIPMVHAVDRVAPVAYAEAVATISSASAGPGTRQNIDEFTVTTARGMERVGGASAAKAIIILNPADPPILMRATIYARTGEPDAEAVERSVTEMVATLAEYVPGYRLVVCDVDGDLVTVMVEVEGAGDFLPKYSGNLDIMTAAAARVGELLAEQLQEEGVAR